MTTRLQEIKDRESKAMKGPWEEDLQYGLYVFGPNQEMVADLPDDEHIARMRGVGGGMTQAQQILNNDFIAHSRADIPWLLERVEEAREIISNCISASGFREVHDCDEISKAEQFLRETE